MGICPYEGLKWLVVGMTLGYDVTAGRILTRVLNIGTIMVQTPNISTKYPQQ